MAVNTFTTSSVQSMFDLVGGTSLSTTLEFWEKIPEE